MGYPQEPASNPYASTTIKTNPTNNAITSAFSPANSPVTSAISELQLLPEAGGFNIDKIFDYKNSYSADPFKKTDLVGGGDTPWYQDSGLLQSYAGLAGSLMEAYGMKGKEKHLRAQTKGLKQNIAFMNEDQTFRRNAKNNINRSRVA